MRVSSGLCGVWRQWSGLLAVVVAVLLAVSSLQLVCESDVDWAGPAAAVQFSA